MKKMFLYGAAMVALSAAPLLAQQPSGSGSGARQGASSGSQGGSSATGTQSGSGAQGGATSSGAGDRGSQTPARAGSPQSSPTKSSNADHDFVMEAAMGGMAEVELGQLASEKAQGEAVKTFAQRMVTDHGRANEELKTLAQNKNISLPSDSGAHHKAIKDRLAKLSGSAFDRAYMQEMLTDHKKDVNAFTKESQSGKDADVKAWAAKTLPTLKEHLTMAESANHGAVGTSGTKSNGRKDSSGGSRGTTGGDRGTGGSGSDASGGSTTPRSGGSSSGAGSSSGSGSSGGTGAGSSGAPR